MRGGRRKLRKEEFDDLCVGKIDEAVDGEMDGSVTYMGVKRNTGNTGRAALILNLGCRWRRINFTLRPFYTWERSLASTEFEAGLGPEAV